MKYVLQFLIIIGFSFVGEVLARVVPLPVPASIWGIVLLFAALEMRLVRVVHIREVSDFLLTIMPILFLPPAVGLIPAWDKVSPLLLEYGLITVVTTFVVMAVAGWVTQRVLRRSS